MNSLPRKTESEKAYPGDRLCMIAQMCIWRCGNGKNAPPFVLDVGTDHAKLPIYLIKSGICRHVIATDKSSGPLERAVKNIKEYYSDDEEIKTGLEFIQADGLSGINAGEIDRVVMAGMGGDVIIGILENADSSFKKRSDILFVLQPQTSLTAVRYYLANNGYRICREKLVCDKKRTYTVIAAYYDGKIHKLSPMQAYIGKEILGDDTELFRRFFKRRAENVKVRLESLKNAGKDYDADEKLYREMTEFAKERGFAL